VIFWLILGALALLLLFAGPLMASEANEIARVARKAGFRGEDLATAVAIAYAESGGDARAYNPETAAGTPPGEGSYGLWQIYLKAHPEFKGLDLFDPQTNANTAFRVYQQAGNSFRPWSTFKSGTFSAHLLRAQQEVSA